MPKKRVKKIEARALYKEGMTTREIGAALDKSRQWVWLCAKGEGMKKLEEEDLEDLTTA